MTPDAFVYALIVQYAVAAGASAWTGQGWKALYWVGALLLSVAVVKMR